MWITPILNYNKKSVLWKNLCITWIWRRKKKNCFSISIVTPFSFFYGSSINDIHKQLKPLNESLQKEYNRLEEEYLQSNATTLEEQEQNQIMSVFSSSVFFIPILGYWNLKRSKYLFEE